VVVVVKEVMMMMMMMMMTVGRKFRVTTVPLIKVEEEAGRPEVDVQMCNAVVE
jgi:hypothetical protein